MNLVLHNASLKNHLEGEGVDYSYTNLAEQILSVLLRNKILNGCVKKDPPSNPKANEYWLKPTTATSTYTFKQYVAGVWVDAVNPLGSGEKGDTGATGSQGNTGNKGDTGSQGEQGVAGTNGTNGTNGTDGTNGSNGIDGATGATGTTGAKGERGSTGAQGNTGSTGTAGAA